MRIPLQRREESDGLEQWAEDEGETMERPVFYLFPLKHEHLQTSDCSPSVKLARSLLH